jgi:hypothetical protein
MVNRLTQQKRVAKVGMRNRILSITRNSIPYVKELKKLPLVDSVNACILMQQLDYWFERYPDGFYKFLKPAERNSAYKQGDSWTEELGFSEAEFRTAFDKIGVRYESKTEYFKAEDKFQGKYYCSYTDKIQHMTYYCRNHALVDAELAKLQFTEIEDADSPNSIMSISRDREGQVIEAEEVNPDYTEITTDTTSNITYKERESFDEANSLSQKEYRFEEEDTSGLVSEEWDSPAHNLRIAGTPKAQAALLPEDFRPSDDTEYWAVTTRPDISFNDAFEKFVAHHRARGTKLVNWDAELRKWLINERPNPAKEGTLGFEHWLNRDGALGMVEEFFMDYGVRSFDDVVKGLPELSRKTIIGCLEENVENENLANPSADMYFSLSDYENDSEYKELVDRQLKALGITYNPPACDSKGHKQAA